MSLGTIFRPATRVDSRKVAELFAIASGGGAEYVWGTLVPRYPGLTLLEVGARRYVGEEGAFPTKTAPSQNSAGR